MLLPLMACSQTLFKDFLFFPQPPPSIPALSLFGFHRQTQISFPFRAVKTHFYVLLMTNWLIKGHLQSLSKILWEKQVSEQRAEVNDLLFHVSELYPSFFY